MFSKFKVETPPNAYQYQLPIVEVYEAEIRKLRCENEFLKVHVVQLNEALRKLSLSPVRVKQKMLGIVFKTLTDYTVSSFNQARGNKRRCDFFFISICLYETSQLPFLPRA